MKKLLLGAMLMLASFAVSAASINLTSTSVTNSTGYHDHGSISVDNGTLTSFSTIVSNDATGPFSAEWDVVADTSYSIFGDIDVSVTASDDWTLSVLSPGLVVLDTFTSNQIVGSSAHGPISVNLIGGLVYTFMMEGTFTGVPTTTIQFVSAGLTETPLPAAVWLFGSVLLGGLAMRRRNKSRQVPVAA
ncbi:hypothetical protein LH51_04040 [Nitrincola sp. A-D6]|uniref:VPLPA-CTERM sorting domain-containing protein n=1 Tax=Nitrincola sp. A-D6 TaxID=1545442 RepID=UPI00051F984A|nr:VPLPA-CTERM sorting domain-containing protein [Nitrincola sp. A-D6]KGK42904.1 hypothetical protein LH51_04040 [Nitrincola sp. A-D6]